jgi:hypothetical protein
MIDVQSAIATVRHYLKQAMSTRLIISIEEKHHDYSYSGDEKGAKYHEGTNLIQVE